MYYYNTNCVCYSVGAAAAEAAAPFRWSRSLMSRSVYPKRYMMVSSDGLLTRKSAYPFSGAHRRTADRWPLRRVTVIEAPSGHTHLFLNDGLGTVSDARAGGGHHEQVVRAVAHRHDLQACDANMERSAQPLGFCSCSACAADFGGRAWSRLILYWAASRVRASALPCASTISPSTAPVSLVPSALTSSCTCAAAPANPHNHRPWLRTALHAFLFAEDAPRCQRRGRCRAAPARAR